jgi:hypothetical protein
LVRGGVECRPLPEETQQYVWEPVDGEEEGEYFMPLPVEAGTTPPYETFHDLYLRLQKSGRTNKDLALLDRAADLFLATAARMHAAGVGMGLVHPENVLLVGLPQSSIGAHVEAGSGAASREDAWLEPAVPAAVIGPQVVTAERVVLPDANCVWHSFLQPQPPAWIKQNRWAGLWNRSPADINQSVIDNQVAVGEDICTLARILAYLLVGDKVFKEWAGGDGRLCVIPSPKDSPETGADVWRVFDDALCGRIESVVEFRKRLDQLHQERRGERIGPMTAHYLQPPPLPPLTPAERVARRLKQIAFAVAAAVILGLVGWGIWHWTVLRPERKRTDEFARAADAVQRAIDGRDLAAAKEKFKAIETIPESFFASTREEEVRTSGRLKERIEDLERRVEDEEYRKTVRAVDDAVAEATREPISPMNVARLESVMPAVTAISEASKSGKVRGHRKEEIERALGAYHKAYHEIFDSLVRAEITKLRDNPVTAEEAIARLKPLVNFKVPSTWESSQCHEQLKRVYRQYGGR